MKTNEEIAKGISEGEIKYSVNLSKFAEKDEKVKNLIRGDKTITQFLREIVEDDPYAPIFLYENKYAIQDKKVNLPPDHFLSDENYNDIAKNYEVVKEVYPELFDHLNQKPCKGCGAKGHAVTTANCIVILGGTDRDAERLRPFCGDLFTDKIKETKPSTYLTIDMLLNTGAKPTNTIRPPVQVKQQVKELPKLTTYQHGKFLVGQCLSCVDEHIATAGIYLEQFHKDKDKYMTHYKRAVGHLSHAEIECLHINREFSELIRVEKLELKEDSNYIPNIEKLLRFIPIG